MDIKVFDTHTHLNFSDYNKDRKELIEKTLEEGIGSVVPSTNFETSKKALEIAQKFAGVFAAVGLHPSEVEEEKFDYKKYVEKFGDKEEVKAIGETGLDFKEGEESKEEQKKALFGQIQLARELELPLIFHCRKAHSKLLKILRDHSLRPERGGVIHCFVGNWEQAQKYLDLGFLLGFNGIIFKLDLDEIIKKTPLDKMVLETDSPFLSPPGFDKKRNDPRGVKEVAKKVAKVKGKEKEEVFSKTTKNAKELFNLKGY